MKLSEAIRLGAMMGPQIFGNYYGGAIFGEGLCAMGGAFRAVGAESFSDVKYWPWMVETMVLCPVCGGRSDVGIIVVELNDDHRWTRERIADWVATIEPQEVDHSAPVTIREEVFGEGPCAHPREEVKV